MMPTLDAALLYSSRAGSDLGLRRDLIHHSRVTLLMKQTLYHQARLDIGCTCFNSKEEKEHHYNRSQLVDNCSWYIKSSVDTLEFWRGVQNIAVSDRRQFHLQ